MGTKQENIDLNVFEKKKPPKKKYPESQKLSS